MKKERRSNIFYGITALLFSIILFVNANGRDWQASLTSTPESFEETVNDAQVNPIYDSDKYYIHGFSTKVKVELSSANRVQLNAEANPDTRSFRVVADLTSLSEGTHEVRLRTQNLSSAVTATLEPTTITVTIEKKVSKEFPVEPVVSTSNLQEGFKIAKTTVEPEEVTIISGDKTIADIDRVVATVNPDKLSNKDFSEDVEVVALDKAGNSLSVQTDPNKVTVKVKVTAPEKEVGLYTTQTGEIPNGVSRYNLELGQHSATIKGPLELLDEITSISVPVDISNITRKTVRTIEIPAVEGITISPSTVSVEITPVNGVQSSTGTTTSGNSQSSNNKRSNNSGSANQSSSSSKQTDASTNRNSASKDNQSSETSSTSEQKNNAQIESTETGNNEAKRVAQNNAQDPATNQSN